MLKQRQFNVDSTLCRWINVASTLFQRCVPAEQWFCERTICIHSFAVCNKCNLLPKTSIFNYIFHYSTASPTRLHRRPVMNQISQRIHAVWWESSQCTPWLAKDQKRLQADSEDSDQTARMRKLIWVFAGGTCNLVRNTAPRHILLAQLRLRVLSLTHLGLSVKKNNVPYNMCAQCRPDQPTLPQVQ